MKRYTVTVKWEEVHEQDVEVRARSEEEAKAIAYENAEPSINTLKQSSFLDAEIVHEANTYDGPDTAEEAEGVR